jgi:hypothetical protein
MSIRSVSFLLLLLFPLLGKGTGPAGNNRNRRDYCPERCDACHHLNSLAVNEFSKYLSRALRGRQTVSGGRRPPSV